MENSTNKHVIKFRKPDPYKKPKYTQSSSHVIISSKSHLFSMYTSAINRKSRSQRKNSPILKNKSNHTIGNQAESPIKLISHHSFTKNPQQVILFRQHIITKKVSQSNSKIENAPLPFFRQIPKPKQFSMHSPSHSKPRIAELSNQKRNKLIQIKYSSCNMLSPVSPSIHQSPCFRKGHHSEQRIFKNAIKNKNVLANPMQYNLKNVASLNNSQLKEKLLPILQAAQTLPLEDEKCIKTEISKLFNSNSYINKKYNRESLSKYSDSESTVLYDENKNASILKDSKRKNAYNETTIEEKEFQEIGLPTPLLKGYSEKYRNNVNENSMSVHKLHLLNIMSSEELNGIKLKIDSNLRKEVIAQSIKKSSSFDNGKVGLLNNPLRNGVEDLGMEMIV